MLPRDASIVSVDDHIIEPPHVWQDRLPRKMREAGPHVEQDDAGEDFWVYEGRRYPGSMISAIVGTELRDWRQRPFRFADIREGCYDTKARLVDMDTDGVAAQVAGPSVPRIGGTLFLEGDDKELALACVQAWNDFVIDEWCAVAPDRFVPVAIVPLWDVGLAIAELERAAAKGARMLSFVEDPSPLGLPSFYTPHWDPLFDAVQDADVAVSLHFGSSGRMPFPVEGAPWIATQTLLGCNSMAALTHLVFARFPQRFPRVRFVISESGIGWVPYLVERMDQMWYEHRAYQDIDYDARPSELYARHFWMCTILTEDFGFSVYRDIRPDRILIESDYPHADSRWPHTRERAETLLTDVPDDDARAIAEGNATAVLRFPAHGDGSTNAGTNEKRG